MPVSYKDNMMLADILVSQQTRLTTLAQGWLALGATTFSIWENEQLLANWPDNTMPNGNGLSVPISVGQNIVGELRISGLNDDSTQLRLTAEADLIGQLIKLEHDLDNMTAELIDAQDQLLALYDLSRTTRSQLDIEPALGLLAQEAQRLTKAKGAFCMFNTPNQPVLIEQDPASLLDITTLHYFFQRVTASGGELLLHSTDISTDLPSDVTAVFLKTVPVRRNLTALLGVLLDRPAAALSPYLKLTRAIAEYAGSQLENAVLHQETLSQAMLKTELELAARIQLQLLPHHAPEIAGLEIAAGSRPALHVGGDFYDFSAQSGGPLTFVVGDVSGKGVSAALLMAMTRTMLRSRANSLPTPTPEVVMGYANELLYDDFTEVGMFATVFVGCFDQEKRSLSYANAGHSPVCYCPAGGSAHILEADGPAMGVLPMSLSENQMMTFNPGDLLIVATDGFSEASSPDGEMFGYSRLLALVEAIAHKSANEIADTMFDIISDFSSGHPQDDDQTLIVVKGVEA